MPDEHSQHGQIGVAPEPQMARTKLVQLSVLPIWVIGGASGVAVNLKDRVLLENYKIMQ